MRWFAGTLVATACAAGWYLVEARAAQRWPGGSSTPGLALGIVAAVLIAFELLLWLRKTRPFRTARLLGSAQLWMTAHIWLGLLTVPLVLLHSSFDVGGAFTSTLMATFGLVIFSGILGLVLQNFVPRLMMDRLRGETVYSQIDAVAEQYVQEASQIVAASYGQPGSYGQAAPPAVMAFVEPSEVATIATLPVVGARRRISPLLTLSPEGSVPFPVIANADRLGQAFQLEVRPFLMYGRGAKVNFVDAPRCRDYFAALRGELGEEAWPALEALEELCARRRDLSWQRRWHGILHGWLVVHLPLSLVLAILLAIHMIQALRTG